MKDDVIYNRKVWRYVRKSDIPKDLTIIGCTCFFKKKGNGIYRARLCTIGYSQILGVAHDFAFAPLITETTFRVFLVVELFYRWVMEIVDVETAFLYGDLEKEIYM